MSNRIHTLFLVSVLTTTGCAFSISEPDAEQQQAAVTIPLKHVVVIVKENHTFDNYFGSFPGAEGTSSIVTPHGTITPPHGPDPCRHISVSRGRWPSRVPRGRPAHTRRGR